MYCVMQEVCAYLRIRICSCRMNLMQRAPSLARVTLPRFALKMNIDGCIDDVDTFSDLEALLESVTQSIASAKEADKVNPDDNPSALTVHFRLKERRH